MIRLPDPNILYGPQKVTTSPKISEIYPFLHNLFSRPFFAILDPQNSMSKILNFYNFKFVTVWCLDYHIPNIDATRYLQ